MLACNSSDRGSAHGKALRRQVLRSVQCLSLLLIAASNAYAEPVRRWDFNKAGESEGWAVPQELIGAVMGGSVWISLKPTEPDPARLIKPPSQLLGNAFPPPDSDKGWTEPRRDILHSASGINVSVPEASVPYVHLRLLNRSPVTDLFISLAGSGVERRNAFRCPMAGDREEWQEVRCVPGKGWSGAVERVTVEIAKSLFRGDMWIDSVEVGWTDPPIESKRPDVGSDLVVPRVSIPGLSQSGFSSAFKVLDACLIVKVPVSGFTHPVMMPDAFGKTYGENWWPMDSSLSVVGAQWTNQQFAEGVMIGFRDVQNPDGNIPALGYAGTRGQVSDVSQLPLFFKVAYDVARRASDPLVREATYQTMHKYLDWWLSPVKRDLQTGLISSVAEETSTDPDQWLLDYQSRAHLDTNVTVAIGAKLTAELATLLGKTDDADRYTAAFMALSRSINTYMWDEVDQAFYNYDLKGHQRVRRLLVNTLFPLRFGIAGEDKQAALIQKLQDPSLFNWGHGPLTGLSKTENDYKAAMQAGRFVQGTGAWFGDVVTFKNVLVIEALEEKKEWSPLAAQLNWELIKAFHGNYYEHLFPTKNLGHDAQGYAWSAAQYIHAIIGHLFGIDYSALEKRLQIAPHVPVSLYGKEIEISNLMLPTGGDTRATVRVRQISPEKGRISVSITGDLPTGSMELILPESGMALVVPVERAFTAEFPHRSLQTH